MKKPIILFAFLWLNAVSYAQGERFFSETDAFLQRYVKEGKVQYAYLKEHSWELEELIDQVEQYDLRNTDDKTRKAFYLNAYNLLVIRGVILHYPVKSPMDIPGFFNGIKYLIAGEKLTLNDIENKKIREIFNDPRIHFALVCAALSCPPLQDRAYIPSNVDSQLQAATISALNNASFIRVDEQTNSFDISYLFEWYQKDFTSSSSSSSSTVPEFINQYRVRKIPSSYKMSFYTYDWTLNDGKFEIPSVDKAANIESNLAEQSALQGASDTVTISLQPKDTLDASTVSKEESGEVKNTVVQPEQSSNITTYTPSVLLGSGKYEIKVFNNLYTQTAYFNETGDKVKLNERSTYYSGIVQFLVGLKNLNAGVDVIVKSVRIDSTGSSPLGVFSFGNDGMSRTAVTSIGPKIKFVPFRNIAGLTVQSTLYIPIADDPEGIENGKPYLDGNHYHWYNQIFYDRTISRRFKLFGEADISVKVDKNLADGKSSIATPLKLFISYFPLNKFSLYGLTEFAPAYGNNFISSYYVQSGAGLKYQITRVLELEGLITKFWAGQSAGAGATYNLGIRIIN